MSVIKNINIPNFDASQANNADYLKKIINALKELQENLRYAIGNIDDDNITQKFIDDLTVKNLLITSGDNSIVANPADGFKMSKGVQDVLVFNIQTGEAYFYGDIIGGIIKSDNYLEDVSGMKINLSDGTIDSVGLKYADNLLEAISGMIGGFRFDSDPESGGLFYNKDGKYIRISPISSTNSDGTYNTKYGVINLGTSDGTSYSALIHLRTDGYARFGLTSENGVTIRFNDFLRYDEGTDGATNTVFYVSASGKDKFYIDRDGKVHISSSDVPKAISSMNNILGASGNIETVEVTYTDSTTDTIDINYNPDGYPSKIGDTVITWEEDA